MNRKIVMVLFLFFISLIPIPLSYSFEWIKSSQGIDITNNPSPTPWVKYYPPNYQPIIKETYIINRISGQIAVSSQEFDTPISEFGSDTNGDYIKWKYPFSKSLSTGYYRFYTKANNTYGDEFVYHLDITIDISAPTIDEIKLYENGVTDKSYTKTIEKDNNAMIRTKVNDLDGATYCTDECDFIRDTKVIEVWVCVDTHPCETLHKYSPDPDGFYTFDLTGLSKGLHTIYFYARDNLTNLNNSVTYEFNVDDTIGPRIEVLYPKTGVTYLFKPTIKVQTSEPATCNLRLYESSYIGQFTKETDNIHSLTLPDAYQLLEGQTRSFNVSCIDDSNNPSSLKFDILLDPIAPQIYSFTLTRPSPIYSWDNNNKLTSLHIVTTKETICKQKGYTKEVGQHVQPSYDEMNYFSDLSYSIVNEQDITDEIIDLGVNGDFRFYVMCEAKNGLKTTLNLTDIHIHVGELFWTKISPLGRINNKDPLLYIDTSLVCYCDYDDGSGFRQFGGRSTKHEEQLHFDIDGSYSYRVRCYTGISYLTTEEDYRFEVTISFTLDTATIKPRITSIKDSLNNEVKDSRTKDTNLVVDGIAEPNSTITTYVKDINDGIVYMNITKSWAIGDFVAKIVLPDIDGSYSIYSSAIDVVGNQNVSDMINVTLDKSGPIAPMIWSLPSETEYSMINVVGYVGESDVIVYVGASEKLERPIAPYINTGYVTYNSNLRAIIQAQDQEGNRLVIPEALCSSVNQNDFIWFDGIDLPYFSRYKIIRKEPGWLGTCLLTLSPSPNQDLVGRDLFVYDTMYPSGWFNISLQLIPEIQNYITVYAEDNLGNIGDEAVVGPVYFHINPPTLNDSIPFLVGQPQITIGGKAKPLSNVVIYRNNPAGQVVEIPTQSDINGEFMEVIELVSGENTIYAVIVNQLGNPITEKSNELIVIYDDQNPVFEDYSPSGSGFSKDNIEILVYVWDNIALNLSTLNLIVDNNRVNPFFEEIDSRLRISYTTSFTTEDHTIKVSIMDLVGNIGEYNWSFSTYIPPQCDDSIDNDRDGLVDYMIDPGCDSQSDDNESNPVCSAGMPQCWDCIDNDGDYLIDYMQDLDCDNYWDNLEETVIIPICGDNLINQMTEDCDKTDLRRLSCQDFGCNTGTLICDENCRFDIGLCSDCGAEYCGDGVKNREDEECDTLDLNYNLCTHFNDYTGGVLGCTSACEFDFTQCTGPTPRCGDNVINRIEELCDGEDLGGVTCQDLGFVSGDLACKSTCDSYILNGCYSTPYCGDGVKNREDEECDVFDLGDMTCESFGFVGGTLSCREDCKLDRTNCGTEPPRCGDNIINQMTEDCDGTDVRGLSCVDFGCNIGNLDCIASCKFDISQCSDCGAEYCGDNVINGEEECDNKDLYGRHCINFDDYTGGVLGCTSACEFDFTQCTGSTPRCGDNVINKIEELCDGEDLGGVTCQDLGFVSGDLACKSTCDSYILNGCYSTPYCGDGVKNREDEECDVFDLGDMTCESFGFVGGTLSCREDCIFDKTSCISAPIYQCSDGIDNDGDRLIDYGFRVGVNDPGCDNLADNDETDLMGPPNIIMFRLNNISIKSGDYFNETVNNIAWAYETEVTFNKIRVDGTDYDTGWSTRDKINYLFDVTLGSGSHKVFFTATNLVAQTTQSLSFNIDTILPTITIDNWDLIGTQYLNIDGSCGDNLYLASIQLLIDGVLGDFPLQCISGHYKAENINLGEGRSHTITVIAIDRARNSNSYTIIVDTGIPVIDITNIIGNGIVFGKEPYKTNSKKVTIRGTYFDEDFDSIEVLLNDIPIQSPELYNYSTGLFEGRFEVNITLFEVQGEEFMNNITLIAKDYSGFNGKEEITIIKDLRGPLIVRFEPETYATKETKPIIGITTDEVSVQCFINYPIEGDRFGEEFTKINDTKFMFSPQFDLKYVYNEHYDADLSITCIDLLGNSKETKIILTVDLKDPTIERFYIDEEQGKKLYDFSDSYKKYIIFGGNLITRLKVEPSESATCEYYDGLTIRYFDNSVPKQSPQIILNDLTNYTYNILCIDKSGRKSETKTIFIQVNTQLKTDKPQIYHEYPSTGSKIGNKTIIFSGSIISLTPGADIIESEVEINHRNYSLSLTNGKYSEPISFDYEGIYNFTIWAKNSRGLIGSDIGKWFEIDTTPPAPPHVIIIEPETEGLLPVANAGLDQIVVVNNRVTLDGSASSDSDGNIVSYSWVQTSGHSVIINNANNIIATFTPTQIGSYTFKLTITDNDGLSHSDTVIITVQIELI